MKTQIYNLIILDESGSMDYVKDQTVSGCNETINTITEAQRQHSDTLDNFVSIYAFQGNGSRPSRYIIKNDPAGNVKHITGKDYKPYGTTPLYDAIGTTLIELKELVKKQELAIGSVTIITDGAENASQEFTRKQVAMMIEELRKLGWNFNFIGANIDVERAARDLNIDNSMEFKQDDEGTRMMFAQENKSRKKFLGRLHQITTSFNENARSEEERNAMMADASQGYFDETDDDADSNK